MNTAYLELNGKRYALPVLVGTQGELGVDIRDLRKNAGCVTYDPGYGNTACCRSAITFVDGQKGILRHRGYPIEWLAEHCNFLQVAQLIIYGELPNAAQYAEFDERLKACVAVHDGIFLVAQGVPCASSPMAVLSALLSALGCYHPDLSVNNREQELAQLDTLVSVLMSKVRTLAALCYRKKQGLPLIYPRPDLGYAEHFLHLFFSESSYEASPALARALDLIFLLHADHEQNCSTATLRMVGSSGSNVFACVSAAVNALWGPLHGGANVRVCQMLEAIHASGEDGSRFIEAAKSGKAPLVGFGHRVYKNYDPRAQILKKVCKTLLAQQDKADPLLEIAQYLEAKALEDPYFIERKLYPNVDFYSGILLRAIGIPLEFFPVIFAIGRMPGWIANWVELTQDDGRISRPRQIYVGQGVRS